MEQEFERLAHQVLGDFEKCDANQKVIIGIAGVPGSGKSTVAAAVASRINDIYKPKSHHLEPSDAPLAVAITMDGFHYSRAQLAKMPNPEEAIHRRGAAFTFDGEGFHSLIKSLRSVQGETVLAPSFGHEIKDPVPDSIVISPASRIVLVEGNYCALNRAPWKDAAKLMTRLWYIDTPAEITHQRLAKRHLASGIVRDEQEAWERATGTDELNAQDIRNNLLAVDEVLRLG
ncbi:phosphoribulokinase/uridine kinase [Dactylonectria macrodidyma]|uniref:Phosphoribulokinase/uridine kinase n=1 Tax=Dactylonectria macrodidyma TaxID=307937 RepID=A0A9P9DZ29_9HYPO|nr:phosphoribulokinase/uridine kinase [Dactylonectria macrodidyma]